MKCPVCGYPESRVVDSRPSNDFSNIRRRRECLSCKHRFTTYEIVDTVHPVVIKRDGSKELFDKSAEAIANDIELSLSGSLNHEVSSADLGEMVMSRLKKLDPVAYVRFASVHREFRDVETFISEINKLRSEEDAQTRAQEQEQDEQDEQDE